MFLQGAIKAGLHGDFSLPTQRCFPGLFLFGYSLATFLCLRRGVSPGYPDGYIREFFSLPTQRCFLDSVRLSSPFFTFLCLRRGVSRKESRRHDRGRLFSAYAEVFPPAGGLFCHASSFLCLRRGVSRSFVQKRLDDGFSLPTQRCFFGTSARKQPRLLFSAYAEVFPKAPHGHLVEFAFLCLRRGVSSAD